MEEALDARAGWLALRRRGQVRLVGALVAVLVVVFVVGFLAGANAPVVGSVVILVAAAVVGGSFWLWQRHTGMSLTPDWAPERADATDEEVEAVVTGDEPAERAVAPTGPAPDHFDAQILATDLARLGQVVPDAIRRSYASGNLSVVDGELRWDPAAITAKRGVSPFVIPREQVGRIDVSELWGSWSLVSLERTDGTIVGLRVPTGARPEEAFAAR